MQDTQHSDGYPELLSHIIWGRAMLGIVGPLVLSEQGGCGRDALLRLVLRRD